MTISLLVYLESNGWEIIAYDYPQSGTGRAIHPNPEVRVGTKNQGAFIPDIVAVKGDLAIFFENKNRYYSSDFQKIETLRTANDYTEGISALILGSNAQTIFYGVGVPNTFKTIQKCLESRAMIDFLIAVNVDQSISVPYDPNGIF